MEGVSSDLFSGREEGPPAVSPSRFRQDREFPTGAAFLKSAVRNDVVLHVTQNECPAVSGNQGGTTEQKFRPYAGRDFFCFTELFAANGSVPCLRGDLIYAFDRKEYREEGETADDQRGSDRQDPGLKGSGCAERCACIRTWQERRADSSSEEYERSGAGGSSGLRAAGQ